MASPLSSRQLICSDTRRQPFYNKGDLDVNSRPPPACACNNSHLRTSVLRSPTATLASGHSPFDGPFSRPTYLTDLPSTMICISFGTYLPVPDGPLYTHASALTSRYVIDGWEWTLEAFMISQLSLACHALFGNHSKVLLPDCT